MLRIQGKQCLKSIGLVCKRSAASDTDPKLVNLFVNGKAISVEPGTTILQACQEAGYKVPHFCYHPRLAIAGNCRMCLVEVEKNPKPVASCAMTVMPGMRVQTESVLAKRAREGILEFILANHPLDCPICDQGGECDLQDLSMYFGNDRTRFTDVRFSGKRSVIDKNFGPLIATSFTKCIHCTRCVRFANEVAGVPYLGTTGRGNNTQIGMYIERLFLSELSGNVIDLCPVGALVSKPYSFTARPWETRKTESIDVMDALGSNITVYSRSGCLLRILPRLNEEINEEWLSDKARFAYDGHSQQRLVSPMIRFEGRPLTDCDWPTALNFLSLELKNRSKPAAVIGDMTDCETIVAMKDLLQKQSSNDIFLEEPMYSQLSSQERSGYLFNTSIADIEKADLILLVNTNPRYEAPLVNARIRKTWLQNSNLNICLIGPSTLDLTYDTIHLGEGLSALQNVAEGKNENFNKLMSKSQNPLIIVGSNSQKHSDCIYDLCWNIACNMAVKAGNDWNPFNLLHKNCNTVGALDLGCRVDFDRLYENKPDLLFILNCDTGRIQRKLLPSNCLVVYIGHHGDNGAQIADLILPGCMYTEKSATFVNTEGRVQVTKKAVSPPGIAREDWKIIRALSEFANRTLPYDDAASMTRRLIEANSVFSKLNCPGKIPFKKHIKSSIVASTADEPFILPMMTLSDYWMTNAITRASPVMANCVKATRAKVAMTK